MIIFYRFTKSKKANKQELSFTKTTRHSDACQYFPDFYLKSSFSGFRDNVSNWRLGCTMQSNK
jgi:hypothetical protein